MKDAHSSTHKKVVVRRLDKGLVKGYVNPGAYLGPGVLEVLDLEGRVMSVSLEQIKGIYFVRDFDGNHDRPERKVFRSRPRLDGLWVRMTFKDAEVLDGLISENLLTLDSRGFLVTLPDVYSNNQKIFVPRQALASIEVLRVVSNGARRLSKRDQPRPKVAAVSSQIGLFPACEQTEAK